MKKTGDMEFEEVRDFIPEKLIRKIIITMSIKLVYMP